MKFASFSQFVFLFFIFASSCFSNIKEDFLIIANGPYEHEVIKSLMPNRTIIVLDGAANHLKEILPDYILGDLDSISSASEEKYKRLDVKFVKLEDQNYTDLEKAILFARDLGAKTIAIASAFGGPRSDHSVANLSILKKYYSQECELTLHTTTEIFRFLKDEKFCFTAQPGKQCGFFGWPMAIVSTSGLVWDVNEWEAKIGNNMSCSNMIKNENVEIIVKGDLLLIYPNK
ncbi:MAG: thiamine diphosphokinase [Chlamydiae bacterium]|nr:thiamine diphosphokinase [Chlamydiota bacterium]